jgi:hypothetical protein
MVGTGVVFLTSPNATNLSQMHLAEEQALLEEDTAGMHQHVGSRNKNDSRAMRRIVSLLKKKRLDN